MNDLSWKEVTLGGSQTTEDSTIYLHNGTTSKMPTYHILTPQDLTNDSSVLWNKIEKLLTFYDQSTFRLFSSPLNLITLVHVIPETFFLPVI